MAPKNETEVFSPVLAAPVVDEKPRVSGWVFVAAFVAFISPIVAVTAYMTERPAPKPAPPVKPSTITVTGPETVASVTPTATETATQATKEAAPCMCMPPPRPKATATATATTVKREPPKPQCCAGETEMQCAMRRSVGATCG